MRIRDFKSFKTLTVCLLGAFILMAFQNCTPGFSYDTALSSLSSIDQIEGGEGAEAKVQRGRELYATNCEHCHSQVDITTKRNITIATLTAAVSAYPQMNFLNALSSEERELIVLALNRGATPNDLLSGTPSIAKSWPQLSAKSCAADGVARDLSLLTRAQYKNAIEDIFGLAIDVSALPIETRDFYLPEASSGGQGLRDINQLQKLYEVAAKVAASFESNFATVARKLVVCDPNMAACETEFSIKLLSRLYRRNLSSTDEELVKIRGKFASASPASLRLKNLLIAGLMSPRFLYVAEFEPNFRNQPLIQSKLRTLSDVEVASRLSFLIWNSVPDETLLALADSKTLSASGVLKAQVSRMLADPRSQRFAKNFAIEWLGASSLDTVVKDDALIPGFSPSLMLKMKTETELFVMDQFNSGNDVRSLFTAANTFVDSTLAAHYGISGVSGSAFTRVNRSSSAAHAGLLSQGSIAALTSQESTDPIHRGLYVYSRFHCGRISDPPASASLVVFEGTKYEQLMGRSENQNCGTCHSKFEPYGYVYEAFDPLGRARAVDENGVAIGRTVAAENGDRMTTMQDLGAHLAANPLAGFCLMRNLEKYALSSGFAFTRGLQCHTENQLFQAYRNGNSLKSYVEAVVLSPVFLQKLETY